MLEDEELAKIRKKKMEELMKQKPQSKAPAVIEVFTSPTCPHCPSALLMAKELAAQMPGIRVVEQSTATAQGFAKAAFYNVQSVPTIYINGKRAFVGAPPSIEALRQALRS